MPKITFIDSEEQQWAVDAVVGETLMETALNNGVEGIDAECGGSCSCATCHVFVAQDYFDRLKERDDIETSMLELSDEVAENSRLSCQIEITDDLDGMVVNIPSIQG